MSVYTQPEPWKLMVMLSGEDDSSVAPLEENWSQVYSKRTKQLMLLVWWLLKYKVIIDLFFWLNVGVKCCG